MAFPGAGTGSPRAARIAASSAGAPGPATGSSKRWQTLHWTPWRSPAVISEPSAAAERPSSQPLGRWQRRQVSPESSASWFATAMAAQLSGSRPDCAIIEPCQLR